MSWGICEEAGERTSDREEDLLMIPILKRGTLFARRACENECVRCVFPFLADARTSGQT